MTEIIEQCLGIILPSVAAVIAIIFGVLGVKIKSYFEVKFNTETSKKVVEDVVKFIQQVYTDLDGQSKLEKALTDASTLLTEKGIKVSDTELRMLIESAVYGMKQGFLGETILIDDSTLDDSIETQLETEIVDNITSGSEATD